MSSYPPPENDHHGVTQHASLVFALNIFSHVAPRPIKTSLTVLLYPFSGWRKPAKLAGCNLTPCLTVNNPFVRNYQWTFISERCPCTTSLSVYLSLSLSLSPTRPSHPLLNLPYLPWRLQTSRAIALLKG